ncbi:MAG: XRE family transcriptional regulator [Phenylobacterium sp.]|uniref:helix-turn-helix domain-containing protein n=1 Tax=Phenylobacterium sp. TaxID=1871053 RepID=UPI001220F2C1|nr:helix-turn-helix transcriptional regulator [Phenylobacterium sp.]TAJ68736.1 MAG: XRE family transcriptional regulator [Phenylobacterium sp.]
MPKERTRDDTRPDFGQFLKQIRVSRGLTLRDVERVTDSKISNAYLSQLENGVIEKPSAVMLHRLSAAYAIDYGTLMEKAGFITESDAPVNRVATSVFGELSSVEEEELLRYLKFIRERKD